MTTFHRTYLVLFAALVGPSGCLEPIGQSTETNASSSSSDDGGTSSTTGEPATTTGTTATGESTETPTTGAPAFECGDGTRDEGEACDDGEANGEDAPCTPECELNVCGDGYLLATEECDDGPQNADDAACTADCTAAKCGDGKVLAGLEVCDDGKNDGSYGSCSADCTAQAAHCGDGELEADFEECDSADDPACLSSCMLARSCLVIHESDPTLQTGPRTIYPVDPATPVEVVCDMDTDGGGYTFLKVDIDSPMNDLPYPAVKAETVCASYGMHLFVPRSAGHLSTAYGFATVDNVPPVGGGSKSSSADYLQILGVYPSNVGKSCQGKALTPETCKEWAASDGEAWYITDTTKNVSEPDPDSTCEGCSMIYTWNADGTVKNYKTVPVSGGSSLRFLCDVGDKLP